MPAVEAPSPKKLEIQVENEDDEEGFDDADF